MTRRLGRTMPFPPTSPRAPAPTPGVPAARAPPRRPGAPRRPVASPGAPPAPSPPAAAAERRPPERPEGLLSGSWPSTTLKRPPARRAPGPAPPRAPAGPRRPGPGPSPAGAAGPAAAVRVSLSLTPEAVLLLQRRHLDKQLLARPCRPLPSPSAAAGRPLGPCPCPCARPAGPGRRRPPPGRLQPPGPRPALPVSLLNERHKYDDVEYEEEVPGPDEGLVRKCTEWLRGVEKAAAARHRSGPLDTLPHLSTL